MAVTSVTRHWSGQTGSRSSKSGDSTVRSYTAVYHVLCSVETDGPARILNNSNLPRLGQIYVFGTDIDAQATCKSITPTRLEGRLLWQVVCQYESPESEKEDQQKPGDDGNETTDPEKWRDECELGTQMVSRPIERATYLAGLTGTAAGLRSVGSEGPLQNSAGTVYDPTDEVDVPILTVRKTRWRKTFPEAAQAAVGSINRDTFTIRAKGYSKTCKPHTALLVAMPSSLQQINGGDWWQIGFEVWIDDHTWLREYVDRGVCARAAAGDDDGHGGTISSSDLVDGVPQLRGLVDPYGIPLTEPVLLDGDGAPLEPGKDPVFLKYRVHPEKSFATLGI